MLLSPVPSCTRSLTSKDQSAALEMEASSGSQCAPSGKLWWEGATVHNPRGRVGANPVAFDGAGNITVATPINGTTATLTKTGGGTLDLQVGNTFTGGTTVSGGILSVSNTTGSGTGSGNVSV